jgi:hypothetical protein
MHISICFIHKQKAKKTDDQCALDEIYSQIEQLLEEMPPVLCPLKLFTSDVTPAGLHKLLDENDGRMSIIADEAGIFKGTNGICSNGNIDVYLQGYSGSPIRVDRFGRHVLLPTGRRKQIVHCVNPSVLALVAV